MMPPLPTVAAILMALALTVASLPTSFAAEPSSQLLKNPEVHRFIHKMALKHHYAEERLMELMGKVRIVSALLKPGKPAEALPWRRYRKIFLTAPRIQAGVRFWQTHRDTLTRAQEIHGVPPEIIVAILGVESNFGKRKGKYPVLDSLTTLAFYGARRKNFFRRELEQFLLLIRDEKGLPDPHEIKGSYAGAMGLPQFISSSYRRYAIDFDQDGTRNLIYSIGDAIGSIANYLAIHGWHKGHGVANQARIKKGAKLRPLLKKGIKPRTPFSALKPFGVTIDRKIPADEPVAIIRLSAQTGSEYWVVRNNFYTITRYNHSKLYAMAVYQLAQAIQAQYAQQPRVIGPSSSSTP
uniref:Membrane-bound lytic murein transglycosylase B n=1 Tax=Candidatus Kentrum sp. MB TaxID=2138164 RepID=A0A451BE87_9GAMM|nr:MAG: membrane-bound lytic murein transglycosylase B [Candidatus Kentron sp. MB]VFK34151.1 MAG: membrane-bound lytic murein transglycosylase B [Candidatus Kentron sp. MB]VFK76595.1 MAG: membrane-bound lytic murein transglycosylase B [Candidatus Kentron sp. MB]